MDERLQAAVQAGDAEMLGTLLAAGVDPELPDSRGRTALHTAIARGHVESVRVLLVHGASLLARDAGGRQPLALAAAVGDPTVVDLLLRFGADPLARDGHGRAALHLAARTGAVEVVARLLQAGTPIDLSTPTAWTALHFAAASRRTQERETLASFLVDKGARRLRDLSGREPLDLFRAFADKPGRDMTWLADAGEPAEVEKNTTDERTRLERLLHLAPEHLGTWAVYGDWLSEHGDPRGELINVELELAHANEAADVGRAETLGRRRAKIFEQHGARIRGQLSDEGMYLASLTWRFGFVWAATLRVYNADEQLRTLLDSEASRFLQSLSVPSGSPHHSVPAVMEHQGPVHGIRALELGLVQHWPAQLARYIRLLPLLRDLTLRGVTSEALDLRIPSLERLSIRSGDGTSRLPLRIGSWSLPNLMALEFGPMGPDQGMVSARETMSAILASPMPHLQTLRVSASLPFGIAAVAQSPLVQSLWTLEVTEASGTAVDQLIDHAQALRFLERLVVRGPLAGTRVAALRAAIPRVEVFDS